MGIINRFATENYIDTKIETGEWTPIFSNTIFTSYSASGCYYRIGNMCTISFTFEGTSVAETEEPPEIYLTGVPYPSKPLNTWYAGGGHIQNYYTNDSNAYIFTGWALDRDNIIRCRGVTSSGNHAYIKAGDSRYIYGAGSLTYQISE